MSSVLILRGFSTVVLDFQCSFGVGRSILRRAVLTCQATYLLTDEISPSEVACVTTWILAYLIEMTK